MIIRGCNRESLELGSRNDRGVMRRVFSGSSLLRTSRTVRSLSSDFTSVKYNLLCLLNTAVLAKFSEAGNITTYQVKKGLLTTYLVANGAKLARVLSAEVLGLEEPIGIE